MRNVLAMVLTLTALATARQVSSLDAVPAALLVVGFAVSLAVLLAGVLSPLVVVFGAAGALFGGALADSVPVLGFGGLVAWAFAGRARRARTRAAGAAVVLASSLAGALAMALALRYGAEGLVLHTVAVVVGTLLLATPLLTPVDDRVAHRLRVLAGRVAAPQKATLLRALAVRRRMVPLMEELPRREVKRLGRAWATLMRLVEARATSQTARIAKVDARIQAYGRGLARALRAMEARRALAGALDADVLAEMRIESETIEAEAEALHSAVEV